MASPKLGVSSEMRGKASSKIRVKTGMREIGSPKLSRIIMLPQVKYWDNNAVTIYIPGPQEDILETCINQSQNVVQKSTKLNKQESGQNNKEAVQETRETSPALYTEILEDEEGVVLPPPSPPPLPPRGWLPRTVPTNRFILYQSQNFHSSILCSHPALGDRRTWCACWGRGWSWSYCKAAASPGARGEKTASALRNIYSSLLCLLFCVLHQALVLTESISLSQ